MDNGQTWAPSDDAGLTGGVTHDQVRDEMRRHLEQLFDREQTATKTIKNIGEDGRHKGLTSSYGSREALRFSSEERRQRSHFSPREASYSARQECRFFSDRPARARSLTPDSGIRTKNGCAMIGRSAFAAGVASSSPKGHGRLRAEAYRSRYSNNNIFGTSLPAASSKELPATSEPTQDAQGGAGKPADAQQFPGPLQSPTNRKSQTPLATTSKAVKESLRFFLSGEEACGTHELGVRTERPRTVISSSRPEITLQGGQSRRSLLSSPRAAPDGAHGTQRTKAEEGKPHEKSQPLADHVANQTGQPSMGRASSRDSLPAYRGSRELGGIRPSSRGYHMPYMPGCQDSLKARRFGTRAASTGRRDVQGRDLFERGLRN